MHFGRKFVRQVMFADKNFDVHAEFAGLAQNFDHASGGSHASTRKARELHIHHRAVQFRQAHAAPRRMPAQLSLQLAASVHRPAE